MKKTGIFATKEEVKMLKQAAARGWQPGEAIIALSVQMGMDKDQATVDARTFCHRLALKHGLPEIPGYYGITNDGEFVTT